VLLSETLSNVFGRLVKIKIENSASAQPNADWDIIVYQGTTGGNDYEVIFKDDTVSNSKTSAIVYYPVKTASLSADGSDSTLTEVSPVCYGSLKLKGANMGSKKSAKITLYFEVA